jgi:Ricin-type beta-trefoil lectin domain-like
MYGTFARFAVAAVSAAGLSLGLAAGPAGAAPAATTTFKIYNDEAQECIGIDSGAAGAWACSVDGADQTWHWGPASREGYYELVNGAGKCLATASNSAAEGVQIRAVSCAQNSTDPNDVFWLTGPAPASGWHYLFNYNSGLVIGILGGSNANGAELVQWQALPHPDQYWDLPATP